MELTDQIRAYIPFNDQETADKPKLLSLLQNSEDFSPGTTPPPT